MKQSIPTDKVEEFKKLPKVLRLLKLNSIQFHTQGKGHYKGAERISLCQNPIQHNKRCIEFFI